MVEILHSHGLHRAMLAYEDFVDLDIRRRADHLARVPKELARYLPTSCWSRLNEMQEAAEANQHFFNSVVEFQDYNFTERDASRPLIFSSTAPISATQMHRNEAVLHSLVREWSREGREERDSAFGPLVSELQRLLPVTAASAFQQRVLVPGSGLCRLPVEVASLGYAVQANEFSMFMLTASHFILNGVMQSEYFDIYPWLEKQVYLNVNFISHNVSSAIPSGPATWLRPQTSSRPWRCRTPRPRTCSAGTTIPRSTQTKFHIQYFQWLLAISSKYTALQMMQIRGTLSSLAFLSIPHPL
jgi:hypothetical protein